MGASPRASFRFAENFSLIGEHGILYRSALEQNFLGVGASSANQAKSARSTTIASVFFSVLRESSVTYLFAARPS